MAKTQLVSIVVPIFNEEDGIGQLNDKLLQLRGLLAPEFDLEFIFVDDGSHDRTVEKLREQFAPGQTPCQVIEHGTNQGVGAACRTGFRHSNGSLVCTMDADCTYSPEGLRALLTALRDTGSDIAVASPYHPWGGVEGVPAWRLLLSQSCSALYRWLSPLKLYTYTSIFRVYKAEVVRTVPFKANGFVSAAEILIAAGRQGYRVTEVPMVLRARAIGRSKMKVMRTVVTHLKMLGSFVLPRSFVSSRLPASSERRAEVTERLPVAQVSRQE